MYDLPKTYTPNTRRSRPHRIAFAVALIAVIVTVNLSVTFYRVYTAPAPAPDWRQMRLAHPRPDLPYWSPAFVNEYFELKTRLVDDVVVYDNFHGKYYNTRDGHRITVGQPAQFSHTMWLFGNSTTFDIYVPDNLTYASQIQSMLNGSGYRWRVVNLGAIGTLISGQIALLRRTPISRGDIVVFLDGATDLRPLQGAATSIKKYLASVNAAEAFSRAHGAQFYHFVQPSLIPLPLPPFISLSSAMYDFDGVHLDSDGDAILARAVYDSLTLI